MVQDIDFNVADGSIHINWNHPQDLHQLLKVVKANLVSSKIPGEPWIFRIAV